MTKYILVVVSTLILFTDWDCKKNPVGPGDTNTDTTSHAFTFQQYSWGGGGGSFFKDVVILSDTNILAVGEIHLPDSAGQIVPMFNMARWNGITWNLHRVYYQYQEQQYLARFTAVFAFNANDYWVGSNQPMHWNGTNWEEYDVPASVFNGYINRFFGTSSSNLYMVGSSGAIAHFDGTRWQKLSSPTNLDIMDIYGATNPSNGQSEILAIATQTDSLPAQSQLLKIDGTTVTVVSTFTKVYFSTWFVPGEKYYVVGDGIISTNSSINPVWSNIPIGTITQYEGGCIRGTGLNDILITGSNLDVIHYNGSTWFDYENQIPSSLLGGYPGVALHGNIMVAVGFVNQTAVLLMGKR